MSRLQRIINVRFFALILVVFLVTACGGTKAVVSETWTLVELVTKGERTDIVTEVVEVRNCGIAERKTVDCSAGTSNDLSVSLGGSVGGSMGIGFEGAIDAGVSSSLGLGRESGESLNLDLPPEGFIYRYTVNKEFRVVAGEVLARSSAGDERRAAYAFHASCRLGIESREKLACTGTRQPTSTPTRTKTSAQTEMSTATRKPTPIPTPTTSKVVTQATCGFKPSDTFYSVWQAEQSRLGCALKEVEVFTAEQPFENGFMFWREDRGRFHYVLYNKGTWQKYESAFKEGDPETAGYSPPPGLQEPKRGFGQIWRDELGGPNSEIGWATYHEQGFPDDRWVDCEHGTMLWSGQWGDKWGIFVLYDDDGTWQLKR